MSRILLDTSAYSAMRRGDKRLHGPLAQASEVVVTPVILSELLCGFKKGEREKENRRSLQEFMSRPRVRTLPLDEEIGERCAAIWDYLRRKGTPIPPNALWIAASAAQHGLWLLTTDDNFKRVPHVLVEWIPPTDVLEE